MSSITISTEMSKIALAHGATIDKYIGDAMLLFFGDPESRGVQEDAKACVMMAIAMQRRMRELEQEWRARGLERPFRIRMASAPGLPPLGISAAVIEWTTPSSATR